MAMTLNRSIILGLALSLVSFAGCTKKPAEEPVTPPAEVPAAPDAPTAPAASEVPEAPVSTEATEDAKKKVKGKKAPVKKTKKK